MFFFFQAEDGIRDKLVTGVQTCALPISVSCPRPPGPGAGRTTHHRRVRRDRPSRSGERRVGEEGRSRGSADHLKKKKKKYEKVHTSYKRIVYLCGWLHRLINNHLVVDIC